MNDTTIYIRFGVALAIGVLVGLQREFSSGADKYEPAAGIRTYPLFAAIGCLGAWLSELSHSPALLAVILSLVGVFLIVNYFIEASAGHRGLTSKTAALLTTLIGTLCWFNFFTMAIALAVVVTVLLSVKVELHSFVRNLTQDDIVATLKFAVITAIVLPILPNHPFGPVPFNLFNPFKIWLFVVLISGISFIGYVLIKVAGPEKGIGLTGFLGGLASSTAVTLSFVGRSKKNPELSRSFALAILVAWSVMFGRILIIIAILNRDLAGVLVKPIVASLIVGLLWCAWLWHRERKDKSKHDMVVANPFELGLAIKFGLLFAVILFVSKAAQVYFGQAGVYLSSFVAGLADVDAIALSMAKLAQDIGGVTLTTAARAIVIATVSNTVLKGSLIMFGGAKELKKAILPGFILMVATGIIVVFLV